MNPYKQVSMVIALVFAMMIGTAGATPIHDGILTSANEYANSFETGWYNDHESLMGPGTTTVRWDEDAAADGKFYLYLQAPLSVKNMIWGDYFSGLTATDDGSQNWDEAVSYYQSWCSDKNGNPANLNGSNCDHHDEGFEGANNSFINKILSQDFKTMVDSEAVKIDGKEFKLIETKDGAINKHGASVKSSLTYIFDNNGSGDLFEGCGSDGCDAINTAMSFEMVFDDKTTGGGIKDWLLGGDNDVIFHMSPERGGPNTEVNVPEPSSLVLLALGLAGLGFSRRKSAKA